MCLHELRATRIYFMLLHNWLAMQYVNMDMDMNGKVVWFFLNVGSYMQSLNIEFEFLINIWITFLSLQIMPDFKQIRT